MPDDGIKVLLMQGRGNHLFGYPVFSEGVVPSAFSRHGIQKAAFSLGEIRSDRDFTWTYWDEVGREHFNTTRIYVDVCVKVEMHEGELNRS